MPVVGLFAVERAEVDGAGDVGFAGVTGFDGDECGVGRRREDRGLRLPVSVVHDRHVVVSMQSQVC